MFEHLTFIISQVVTIIIIPIFKIWLDSGNKKIVDKITELDKEVKSTQVKVDEVTNIGLQNKKSNKSLISYRLHKDFGEAIERGYTTIEDFEELSGLYTSYRALGGNGKISALYDKFRKLPIK